MCSRLLIFAIVAIQSTTFSPLAHAEKDVAHKLINSQGCKACHTLGGDGGTVAGSFEAMRGKLTREQVRSKLVNQDQKHGNDKIPDFSHLAEKDIDALVNFIQPDQRTEN